jgi:hypothetical protein
MINTSGFHVVVGQVQGPGVRLRRVPGVKVRRSWLA